MNRPVGCRLLVTGFGPYPGARKNPTEALVAAIAAEEPATFGAEALRTAILPTDYRRSWTMLRRLCTAYEPDVVVHFGLNLRSEAIHVERVGRNAVDPKKPDAAGYAPASGRVHHTGPESLAATLPVTALVEVLGEAGHPALLSDDAGAYVCNATLYRSLHAEVAPRVGFIHVPPEGKAGLTHARLLEAAKALLRTATLPASRNPR